MAAIVASTLRRRTTQQKQYEWKLSTGETSIELMPPRTPSFYRSHPPSSPSPRGRKNERIFIEDFWPECANPEEDDARFLVFHSFETLVPRVNAWLRENREIDILKCETIETKIEHLDDLISDSTMINMACESHRALFVRGLRMWCIYRRYSRPPASPGPPLTIGFLNVVPKCHDTSATKPRYEELPETYAAINNYIIQKHLEGRILTIESLPLKLPSRIWRAPEVDPDLTFQAVEPIRRHHVMYITRIYFVYGDPQVELIGAQDFLPDYISKSHCNCACSVHPRYTPLVDSILKASSWVKEARNIRIVNIQTLETIFKHNPEKVRTGRNFMHNFHRHCRVRFLRISYTSPPMPSPPKSLTYAIEVNGSKKFDLEKNGEVGGEMEGRANDPSQPQPRYKTPSGLSYKTFVPSAVKIGMCTGSPEYEKFSSVWLRSKAWLQCVDRKVLNVETLYHPVKLAWNSQDCGETTSLCPNDSKEINVKMVQMIRVYLDGDYNEPSSDQLPILPAVEEVNDCYCTVI